MSRGSNMDEKKYYQFHKSADLPIFVSCDPAIFDATLLNFLSGMKFDEVEFSCVEEGLKSNQHARILEIEEATNIVAKRIDEASDTDSYGLERVTPSSGYRVYRYKGVGMLIYSYKHKEWRLGCFNDFGAAENVVAYKSVINRFLSWSLASLGLVGFWGVIVDEGVVVMRQGSSRGEAVFIDIMKRRIFSEDGIKKMRSRFQIMKLDSSLHGRNIKMSGEELLSFLSNHCTYFDYDSLSVPVRQLIQSLAKTVVGVLHPQESFKPRTDLSL